jgi:hypothetical protein
VCLVAAHVQSAAASVAEVHDSISVLQPLTRQIAQHRENIPVVRNAVELVLEGQRVATGL